jgi:chromosome segregation ATPase
MIIEVRKESGKILIRGDKTEKKIIADEIEKLRKERISLELQLREIKKEIREWSKIKENFWQEFEREKFEKGEQLKRLENEIFDRKKKIEILEADVSLLVEKKKLLFEKLSELKNQIEFGKNIKREQEKQKKELELLKEKIENIRNEIKELLGEKEKLINEKERIEKEIENRKKDFEKLKEEWNKIQAELPKLKLWQEELEKKEKILKTKSVENIIKRISRKKVELPSKELKLE